MLRAYPDLARRLDLVLSVPGIGERTALAIVIRMPELGRISREEAAALAGLAPFDADSGTHKGQRHIARRQRPSKTLPLRRSPARSLPLEQGSHRALQPTRRTRKSPHRSPRRLRQEAPHLCKYRRPARYSMDRKNRNDLMVATRY